MPEEQPAKRAKVSWQVSWECEFEDSNPRRVGTQSHGRYEKYKEALSISEALSLGASLRDLDYDFKSKHLSCVKAQEAFAADVPSSVDELAKGHVDPVAASSSASSPASKARRSVRGKCSRASCPEAKLPLADDQTEAREVARGPDVIEAEAQTLIAGLDEAWVQDVGTQATEPVVVLNEVATQTDRTTSESELADLTHETYRLSSLFAC